MWGADGTDGCSAVTPRVSHNSILIPDGENTSAHPLTGTKEDFDILEAGILSPTPATLWQRSYRDPGSGCRTTARQNRGGAWKNLENKHSIHLLGQ